MPNFSHYNDSNSESCQEFLQGSLFAAVDAIFGAIVTSHTHRNVISQPITGKLLIVA